MNSRIKFLFFLFLGIFTLFILIEIKYPYFFLQDDNRDATLPYFVYTYKSVISGSIPLFNFHQHLGAPALSNCGALVFYPVHYISTFFSKLFFGHYFATIDITTFFHLTIAGSGFFYLLKLFNLDNKSAFFGAITWPFSSFIIYVSNSWWMFAGFAAYLPWIIYLNIKLYKKPNIKIFFSLVIVRLLMYFMHYPQLFLYCSIFEFITLLVLSLLELRSGKSSQGVLFDNNEIKHTSRQVRKRSSTDSFLLNVQNHKQVILSFIKYYIFSYVCTFFLSLPTLLPIWHHMSNSAARSGKMGWQQFTEMSYNVTDWLTGIFYPFAQKGMDNTWKNLHNLSHIGYLTIAFIVICIILVIKNKNVESKRNFAIVSIIIVVISFMWSANILITQIAYLMPIINRFRWPFKLDLFTNFYLIIIASVGFSYLNKIMDMNKMKASNIIASILILVQILNFAILYTAFPKKSFGIHLDKIPLDEPLKEKINDGRIVTLGYTAFKSNPLGFPGLYGYTANSLGFNYATLWGLYHFAGYDPLMLKNNSDASFGMNYMASFNGQQIPIDYFRKWGVKWYVVSNDVQISSDGFLPQKFMDENRTVYYDDKALPFFFWEKDGQSEGVKYEIKTNTIELEVKNKKEDYLIINFLFNPFFKATIDGSKVKIEKNEINQMKVFIAEGKHSIEIKYSDPYFIAGCVIALIFLLLITALTLIIYLMRKKRGLHPVR